MVLKLMHVSEPCEDFVISLIRPRAEFWIQQSAVALGNLNCPLLPSDNDSEAAD